MLSQYSINHKRGEERRGSYPKGGAVLNFGGREGRLLKMALIRGEMLIRGFTVFTLGFDVIS